MIASYYYDPFGRRLWKEVDGVRTYFHYANEGLIGEYDASGTEIKTYGYKPNSTWTTDPIFMKQDSKYYFYHKDHLGTPQKMTSINGEVVWSATYLAFGEASIDSTSTITNNLRLPGQYFDYETGLNYNHKRYYDVKMGRYSRIDPAEFLGGDINLFIYANNNPISLIDPLGLAYTNPTIRCYSDQYVVILAQYQGTVVAGCLQTHEEMHIADWKARYGENSCVNMPDDSLPMWG